MRICIKTQVQGNYKDIYQRFDRQLFEALSPPFPPMEIVRFDGSCTGDVVHIRFKGIGAEWISEITEDGMDEKKAYFIDKGIKLPFPLTFWEHRHVINKISPKESEIIDDITFEALGGFLSIFAYPLLYISFYMRKNIYMKFFHTKEKKN